MGGYLVLGRSVLCQVWRLGEGEFGSVRGGKDVWWS